MKDVQSPRNLVTRRYWEKWALIQRHRMVVGLFEKWIVREEKIKSLQQKDEKEGFICCALQDMTWPTFLLLLSECFSSAAMQRDHS